MNLAQTRSTDQPWIVGPFKWPPKIDIKQWNSTLCGQRASVVEFLNDKGSAKSSEIAVMLGVSRGRAYVLLRSMFMRGEVLRSGPDRNFTYKAA